MSQSVHKEYDYMFKLVMLGNCAVGKSNILLRYTRNEFNDKSQTTLGVEYAHKLIQTLSHKKIKLQIWDTAGQQQFKAIMRTFYKGTSAAFLIYDITSMKSFEDIQFWYNQIRQNSKNQVVLMLVGNKADLQTERVVSKQKGLEYAQSKKIAFYEVSAKNGTNIQLIFSKIAQELEKIMTEAQRPLPDPQPTIQEKKIEQKPFHIKKQDQQNRKTIKKQKKCCNS